MFLLRLKLIRLSWLFLVLLASCFKSSQLSQIQTIGELKLITRNTPATYFYARDTQLGFEYELVKLFADYLQVGLTVEIANNFAELTEQLNNSKRPAIAAAGLIADEDLAQKMHLSFGFLPVENTVVYHKKIAKPRALDDLVDVKVKVIKDSHQSYFLRELQKTMPDLKFAEEAYEVTDLLNDLDKGKFDIALVNSIDLAFVKFSLQNVRTAFVAENDINLVWATSKYTDSSLIKKANQFLQQIKEDGTLQQIKDKYYAHIQGMDQVGTNTFNRHLRSRLPLYQKYFKQAADEHNLDWRLLAAIGYQESKWLPNATSKTGVRGIMMLTQNTAKLMGVTDRLDPQQSIAGGSKYFVQIKDKLHVSIQEPDRTLFALAAYNIGLGHLMDARALARREGLDDSKWENIRPMLMRLKQQKWHTKTKYGYARGGEAVHFVQNVQRYYDILTWFSLHEP